MNRARVAKATLLSNSFAVSRILWKNWLLIIHE